MARFGTRKKAILTNGNLGMMTGPLVARSGLGAHLDALPPERRRDGAVQGAARGVPAGRGPSGRRAGASAVRAGANCSAGTWPARRRSAPPSGAGSTAAACRPRSWACARITRRRTCWNSQKMAEALGLARRPRKPSLREVDARRRSAEPPPAKPSLAATRRLPASAQQTHRRVPRAPPRPRRTRSRASCTRCRRRDGGQSR